MPVLIQPNVKVISVPVFSSLIYGAGQIFIVDTSQMNYVVDGIP